MNTTAEKPEQAPDFMIKSTLWIAITGLILLAPFAVNDFIQGRYVLGAGALFIVTILMINVWHCSQGRYYPLVTLLGLVPGIIIFLFLALGKLGIIGALWCYPAVIAIYTMLPERKAWIANISLLVFVLPQIWNVLEMPIATRAIVTLIAVSIFSAIFIRIITAQQRNLETLAMTDPLTGLPNRMVLNEVLEHAVDQSHRAEVPMTLLNIDLDYFKAINDSLGHQTGDKVLRGMGDFLLKRIRSSDNVFRLGGEEFLVLLYNTDAQSGLSVAEELCKEIAALPLLPNREVTASIGVATIHEDEEWENWMKRSDENLYRAKSTGRNRVVA